VDASGSIGQDNFDLVKGLIIYVITNLIGVAENGDRVAMMTYSSDNAVLFHFNDTHNYDVPTIIGEIVSFEWQTGGGTATGAALEAARTQMFVPARGWRERLTIVVVLTDGQSQDGTLNNGSTFVEDMAANLRAHTSADVFAIGMHDISLPCAVAVRSLPLLGFVGMPRLGIVTPRCCCA
jgi:Mg-chelatase subunit ChlD